MYKPNILFTFQFGAENMHKVAELGYEVTYLPEETLTNAALSLPYEIMVCYNPFKRIDITALPSLRLIQLVSKGINHVPREVIEAGNIQITNNANSTSIPIAELIISYLLQIYKQAPLFYSQKQEKRWAPNRDILEVYGKTIGFLGTGNIATQAAKRLKAFDAIILGVNRTGQNPKEHFDKVYSIQALEEFLPRCDVVVSTLPDLPDTWHLLNERTLAFMKRGASLINVSRGSIIEEAALVAKLKEGYFRGVALDVFEKEPLSPDSPLWSFDNVIITPHNALYSDLYDTRVFEMVYDNLKRYLNREPLLNLVDFEKGY